MNGNGDLAAALLPELQSMVEALVCEQLQRGNWRWCSVRQAAALLDISEPALYARIRRGTLPAHRLDGRVYLHLDEIDQALRGQTTTADDAS